MICHFLSRRSRAFTLVELLIVVGIIILLAAMLIPTVMDMFNGMVDAQTYNTLAAQLRYARSMAIKEGDVVGLWIQKADGAADEELHDVFFSCVVIRKTIYEDGRPRTRLYEYKQTKPMRVSDQMGVRGILDYTDGGDNDARFHILFDSEGVLLREPRYSFSKVWMNLAEDSRLCSGENAIFKYRDRSERAACLGVQMYNRITDLVSKDLDDEEKSKYLDGQLLTINYYTGQLFPRR
jgi:type II secretory pathway pseudopilin PulG